MFCNFKVLLFALLACVELSAQPFQRDVNFDEGWKFFRGGVERGEYPTLDDSKWRIVRLPHDWSIENIPGTASPFNPDAVSQVSGGFTVGGTGWYRKTFTPPAGSEGQHLLIQFDGVYMNADVWINGQWVGNHPYGYTSFCYDLTPHIKWGVANVLAVQVKNEGQNSRWYSGSGINRHVWLHTVNPVHIAPWGVSVSTPRITATGATVAIVTHVQGPASGYRVVSQIFSPDGRPLENASKESQGDTAVMQEINVWSPELWSPTTPLLYKVTTQLYKGQELVDRVTTTFGIRTVTANAGRGLMVNGIPIKLKGACYHNDNGPLGSRAFDRAEDRRVELLKASGFNAIRCSHNPPAPALLDACDRMGILVIDETFDMWRQGKNPYDYHLYFNDWWKKDVSAMVDRDRNHPSVIMWSIGNEIPGKEKPEVVAVERAIRDYIKTIDPARLVTSAVNDIRSDKDPYFELLDVAGYNYGVAAYEKDHERRPERIMLATESYPLEAFEYWTAVKDHPYVIGDFVWTGFDYIGEASIGWRGYYQEKNFYPWNLAYCGDIDICGWKRPQSFYRDALWMPGQLSLFVKPPTPSFPINPRRESWSKWHWEDVVADWNWKGSEGKPFEVVIYSSCENVELFLNGQSLGSKPTNRGTQYRAVWQVPYRAGSLKAVGYMAGRQHVTRELKTSGGARQLHMQADRSTIKADGQDLSYVNITITDEKGVLDPKAANLVHFEIQGPGTIVGVGNANPVSLESYQNPQRKAWRGRCQVIVQSTNTGGAIRLRAYGDGLLPQTVVLTSH